MGRAVSGCNRRQGTGELGLGQIGVRWRRSLRCREETGVERRWRYGRRAGGGSDSGDAGVRAGGELRQRQVGLGERDGV